MAVGLDGQMKILIWGSSILWTFTIKLIKLNMNCFGINAIMSLRWSKRAGIT